MLFENPPQRGLGRRQADLEAATLNRSVRRPGQARGHHTIGECRARVTIAVYGNSVAGIVQARFGLKVVGVQRRGLREVDRALLVVVGSWTVQDGAAVAVIRAADIVVGARLDEDHPTVVVLDAAGRRAIGLGLPLVGEARLHLT